MKIKKYKKISGNRYQVTIDDQTLILFDEIILKHNLLAKQEIDDQKLKTIIDDNELSKAYFLAIKYLNLRLRTSSEIKTYLQKKDFDSKTITNILNRLDQEGYFNDKLYLSSYINDQIKLTMNGPYKIQNNLIMLGFREQEIIKYLDFKDEIWLLKIKKIITKKVSINHNKSKLFLQQKIMNDLIYLGYDKEIISAVLSDITINDSESFNKIANKIYNQFKKKHEDNKIEYYFRKKMYSLGYDQETINEYLFKI